MNNTKQVKSYHLFIKASALYLTLFATSLGVTNAQDTIKEYHINGVIKNIGIKDSNGTKIGEWKSYNEYGALSSYDKFNQYGDRHGECLSFSTYNGRSSLSASEIYLEGKLNSYRTYYGSKDKLREEECYLNDKKQGLDTYFYENGIIGSRVRYLDGKIDSYLIERDPNGKLLFYGSNEEYKNYVKGENFVAIEDGIVEKKYSNKSISEKGQYKNGLRVGDWTFYYDNGQVSKKGMFDKEGWEQGEWKYFYKNGKLKSIKRFKNKLLNGSFSSYYENGQLSATGIYNNHIIIGQIRSYHENGQLLSELFLDSLGYIVNGLGYHDNGQLKDSINAVYGRSHGLNVSYHKNGQLNYKGIFFRGQKHGLYQTWYENGQIHLSENYLYGKAEGKHVNYDENGLVNWESEYHKNRLHGLKRMNYNNTNQPFSKEFYVNGLKEGKSVIYWKNGQVREIGDYQNDKKIGFWISISEDGDTLNKEFLGMRVLPAPTYQIKEIVYKENKEKLSKFWNIGGSSNRLPEESYYAEFDVSSDGKTFRHLRVSFNRHSDSVHYLPNLSVYEGIDSSYEVWIRGSGNPFCNNLIYNRFTGELIAKNGTKVLLLGKTQLDSPRILLKRFVDLWLKIPGNFFVNGKEVIKIKPKRIGFLKYRTRIRHNNKIDAISSNNHEYDYILLFDVQGDSLCFIPSDYKQRDNLFPSDIVKVYSNEINKIVFNQSDSKKGMRVVWFGILSLAASVPTAIAGVVLTFFNPITGLSTIGGGAVLFVNGLHYFMKSQQITYSDYEYTFSMKNKPNKNMSK